MSAFLHHMLNMIPEESSSGGNSSGGNSISLWLYFGLDMTLSLEISDGSFVCTSKGDVGCHSGIAGTSTYLGYHGVYYAWGYNPPDTMSNVWDVDNDALPLQGSVITGVTCIKAYRPDSGDEDETEDVNTPGGELYIDWSETSIDVVDNAGSSAVYLIRIDFDNTVGGSGGTFLENMGGSSGGGDNEEYDYCPNCGEQSYHYGYCENCGYSEGEGPDGDCCPNCGEYYYHYYGDSGYCSNCGYEWHDEHHDEITCPDCGSSDVGDYGDYYECYNCGHAWSSSSAEDDYSAYNESDELHRTPHDLTLNEDARDEYDYTEGVIDLPTLSVSFEVSQSSTLDNDDGPGPAWVAMNGAESVRDTYTCQGFNIRNHTHTNNSEQHPWWQIHFINIPLIVKKLIFVVRGDSDTNWYNTNMTTEFVLQGSNDGTNFVNIANFDFYMNNPAVESRCFEFNNNSEYYYYRIMDRSNTYHYLVIGELEFRFEYNN